MCAVKFMQKQDVLNSSCSQLSLQEKGELEEEICQAEGNW